MKQIVIVKTCLKCKNIDVKLCWMHLLSVSLLNTAKEFNHAALLYSHGKGKIVLKIVIFTTL